MLNNREWALLIWLAAFLIVVLIKKSGRESIVSIVRTALSPKLVVPFLLMAGWVGCEIAVARRMKIWEGSLGKDTLIWYFTSGVLLFARFEQVAKSPSFFRHMVRRSAEASVFIEVFTGLFVLPLPFEVLLVPGGVIVGGMIVVAGDNPEHQLVKKLMQGLLTAFGLSILAFVLYHLVTEWQDIDKGNVVEQFLLPVWLGIGLLPFVYVLGLYATYELAFMRMSLGVSDVAWHQRLRAKGALVWTFNIQSRKLGSFTGPWQMRLGRSRSFREARAVIREGQADHRRLAMEDLEAAERLVRFAGFEGTDGGGRQLDEREFVETRAALRWLSTCMGGWYRHDDHYVDDLIERFQDDFTKHGLPRTSGITLRVSRDRQSWYAWRRSISGWCFGIGARESPPDEWYYDGAIPPTSFPTDDDGWVSALDPNRSATNW